MSNQALQINCDLGEGVPGENKILPWIDAGSVACGGHCGDEGSIRKTFEECLRAGVKVGAHPSYPDRENFGRKSLKIPFEVLKKSLLNQISVFEKVLAEFSLDFDHIKFHGALYNDAAKSAALAQDLALFLHEFFPQIAVFVPPFSEMENAAKTHGLRTKREVFGDRTYRNDFRLLERNQPKALLTEFDEIDDQVGSILGQGCIYAITDDRLEVKADTICFHGDNPGIHRFLPRIRQKYWNHKL